MTNPAISDFKSYFFRDFPYGISLDTVTDADIQKGIDQAAVQINSELFGTQAEYTIGFLLLAAHFMVSDIRASSQGVTGSYAWLESSKSVGSVSSSASIPQWIMDNPVAAMYAKTNYGTRYLLMVIPLLSGNFLSAEGATTP